MSLQDAPIAQPFILDLAGADQQKIIDLINSAKAAKASNIQILHFESLSEELKSILLSGMQAKLVHVQKIDIPELQSEELNKKFKKPFLDIELRNKLIDLYELDKENMEDPWAALIGAHFKDIHVSGRYRIIKEIPGQREKSKQQMDLATELGGTWQQHLFAFIQKNREVFEVQGFPYSDHLMVGLLSNEPYYADEQIASIQQHLSKEGAYFPFKNITIESTAIRGVKVGGDTCSQDEILLNDDKTKIISHGSNSLINQTVELLKTLTDKDVNIESLNFSHYGKDDAENKLISQKVLDDILDLVKERNKNPDLPQITTLIHFGGRKLDAETEKKKVELENLIAANIRERNKKARGGHLSKEERIVPQAIKKAPTDKPDPMKIRQCKRDPTSAVQNAGVEIQMQQQQQQQQQQQEQQQVQMQMQRQSLLDELMNRKQGIGGLEEADQRSFLTLDTFKKQYENNKKVSLVSSTFGNQNTDILERLWENLTGGEQNDFPGKIVGISKSVAELLLTYPSALTEGLNSHNLPPGFVLRKNKDNPEQLLLDYDLTRATLDIRNKNELQTRFFPLDDSVLTWPGDENQFKLTKAEYQLLGSGAISDIDIFRWLFVELIARENPEFAAKLTSESEFKDAFKLFLHDDLLLLYEQWQKNGPEGVKSLLAEAAKIKSDGGNVKEHLKKLISEKTNKEINSFHEKLIFDQRVVIFKKIIVNEDPIIGQQIIDSYSDLLTLFKGSIGIRGLTNIVQSEGAQGVKIFLDKLDTIQKKHGEQGVALFIEQFVAKKANSAKNLMTDENLKAMDYLASLDKGQYAWWTALAASQVKYDSNMNLLDMTKGFKEFTDKLQKLNPDLKLGDPCPIQDAKNMKVALDRILFILNNAVDPKEQFDNLEGLSLDQLGPYLAMRDAGYYLVTKEMDLDSQHAFYTLNLQEDLSHRKPYTVSLDEFTHANEQGVDYEICRTQYYRLLGQQPYLEPFENYVKVIHKVNQRYELWKQRANSEKAGKLLGEKIAEGKIQPDPRVALALIAYATTHEKAMGTIDANMVDKIFAELDILMELKKGPREKIEKVLLSYLAFSEKANVTPPTLKQIASLISFHQALGKDHEWNKNPDAVQRLVEKVGNSFFETIDSLNSVKEKFKVISSNDITTVIKAIDDNKALEDNNDLRNSIFKLFSKLKSDEFSAGKIDSLLKACLDDPTKIKKLDTLLDIINGIDPAHENTKDLPTIDQMIAVISGGLALEADNYNELFNFVGTHKGFEQCYFGNQKVEEFDAKSIEDQLSQFKDDIINFFEGLITFEDEDFKKLDQLVKKISDFEAQNKDPFVFGKLKAGFFIVLEMIKKNDKKDIASYLSERFIDKNADPVKQKLQNNEISLLHSIIQKFPSIKDPLTFGELVGKFKDYETRNSDVKKFIDSVAVIKARSPQDYQKLLDVLNASSGTSQIPIKTLIDIIDKLKISHKDAFPVGLISTILNNQAVRNGVIATPEKAASSKTWLEPLLREKKVPVSDMQSILDLSLNLAGKDISKEKIESISKLLTKETGFRKDLIKIFDGVIKNDSLKDSLGEVIRNTVAFINYANSQPNADEIKSKFLKSFVNEPALFATTMSKLKDLSDDKKSDILLIISRRNEGKSEEDLKKEAKIKKDETPQQKTAREEREVQAIASLIDNLNTRSEDFLKSLANFDPDIGFPQFEDIMQHQEPSIDSLIKKVKDKKVEQRNKVLADQFSDAEVPRVLEGLRNLATDNPLLYKQREKLQQDFYFINAIGHTHGISTKPPDGGEKKIIKDMSKEEIQSLIKHYQGFVRDPSTSEEAKQNARLVYLALLRETMYRTTGRVPFSTQIISVLNAMQQNGNNIAEIQTGQGKSLMSALNAAMMHLEGQTVDVCTSNMQLAKEGLAENKKFFEYLGVKHTAIDSTSALDDYCIGGINYSDVAQLALFRSRSQIEGGPQPEKASLVLDEADYTLLDDSTQYRYAVNLDDVGDPFYNPYEWAYDLINQFVDDSEDFKNPNATAEDDIRNLRKFIIANAKGAQKDLARDPNIISDKQLDIWIDSAVAARELYKQKDTRWTLREEDRFGNKISVARLIVNDRISSDAQWSNGIQQFVHARINKEEAFVKGGKPKCPLDPEKSAVASTTSKNFLDYYKERKGQVWGITGTIGSKEEKAEHQEKFGFKLTSVPSHQAQKRVDNEPILVETDVKHQQIIFQEVLKRIRSKDKMPALIICKDATTSKALAEYIKTELSKQSKNYPLTLQLYNGIENTKVNYSQDGSQESTIKSEKDATDQAGVSGTITISTPMFGRGTDFKPIKIGADGKEERHPHGLFVVQSYVDSERTSRQIVGRSGRQGAHGETMTIISKEALELDFKLIGKTDEEIKAKHVQAHLDTIRAYKNMTSKEQRLFSESFGDVRNHFFAKAIELIDGIPAYCEEQQRRYEEEMAKDEKDRNLDGINVQDPKALRKAVLKDWEQFLTNIDIDWKKTLNQLDPSKPKDSQLEAAISSLTTGALSKWNKIATDHAKVGDFKISEEEAKALVKRAIEKPFAQKHTTHQQEPYRVLPTSINIHKAYCEHMMGIGSPDKNSLQSAFKTEIDDSFKKLTALVKQDKVVKIKLPKDWDKKEYKDKFRTLNELLLQANLIRSQKAKNNLTDAKYQQLQTEVASIVSWMTKFPAIDKDANEMKQMLFLAHINHRKHLSETAPDQLLKHDQEMQVYSAQGFYPKPSSYDEYKTVRDTTMLSRSLNDSISDLERYKSKYVKSKTRKVQLDALVSTFSKNSPSMDEITKAIINARKEAFTDDKKLSIKPLLFRGKLSFGNRFHNTLDNMQARLIANVRNKDELSKVEKFEKEDTEMLLKQILNKNNGNTKVQDAANFILNANPLDPIDALKQLRGLIASDKNLSERLDRKINRLEDITKRSKLFELKATEQPVPVVNPQIPQTTPWKRAKVSSLQGKRTEPSSLQAVEKVDAVPTSFHDESPPNIPLEQAPKVGVSPTSLQDHAVEPLPTEQLPSTESLGLGEPPQPPRQSIVQPSPSQPEKSLMDQIKEKFQRFEEVNGNQRDLKVILSELTVIERKFSKTDPTNRDYMIFVRLQEIARDTKNPESVRYLLNDIIKDVQQKRVSSITNFDIKRRTLPERTKPKSVSEPPQDPPKNPRNSSHF